MGLNENPSNAAPSDINTPTIRPIVEEAVSDKCTSLEDVDDDEIDSIIMSAQEAAYKTKLWHKINKTYLDEQKRKFLILSFMHKR